MVWLWNASVNFRYGTPSISKRGSIYFLKDRKFWKFKLLDNRRILDDKIVLDFQIFPNFFDYEIDKNSLITDFAGIDIFLRYFFDKSRGKNWIIFVADLNGITYFSCVTCAYSTLFFNMDLVSSAVFFSGELMTN